MKKLFKWTGYSLLSLVFLALAVLLFLLNSTQTIQWAADRYAPQYGFGYKEIAGGLLTGLEVKGLTFEGDTLLDDFRLGWNPAALLYKKVSITQLKATQIDVETIKKVIKAFASDTPTQDDNSSFGIPVSIGVKNLHVTVKPFDESGIGFRKMMVEGSYLAYIDNEKIDAKQLEVLVDTNITTVKLAADSKNKVVKVKNISILDIDSIALESVIKTLLQINAQEKVVKKTKIEAEHHRKDENNLLPKSVLIETVDVAVKPAQRPEIKIDRAELHADSIEIGVFDIVDLKPDAIQMKRVSLAVDTNLSRLNIDTSVEGDTVIVDSLSLQEINTVALTKLFAASEDNNTKTDNHEKMAKSNKAVEANNTASPLIPKYLIVKHFDSSIKSVTYDPVMIKVAEVNASEVKFDIRNLNAQSGEVDILAKSSFGDLAEHGNIKDNRLSLKGKMTPLQPLFDAYSIPINAKTLGSVRVNVRADEEKILVDLALDGKNILKVEEGGFNLDYTKLENHLSYLLAEGALEIKSDGNITTRYTKKSRLHSLVTYKNDTLKYSGELNPGKIEGLDDNLTKPLKDLEIVYQGTSDGIHAQIDSAGLRGAFVLPDYKRGDFNLSTKTPIILKDMVSLPETLQPAWVSMELHAPLDFSKTTPLNATAVITSNLANVDTILSYDKTLKVLTRTIFPKDSLLRQLSKELNLDALSPLQTDITMNEKVLNVDAQSNGLISKVVFNLENKNLDGDLVLGGAKFIFSGNVEKEVKLENRVGSLQDLMKKISTIYTFEVPPLDGDMKVSLGVKKMKELELLLTSNALTYKADRAAEHVVNDTMISLGFADSVLKLNRYHTTFKKQKIFATKPSVISLKEGNIEISPLWVNDELKVTGTYNVEKKKGEILAYANPLTLSSEMIDLSSRVDVKTKIDGVSTAIDGVVTIMGGDLHYDLEQKSFASDSDIIIVQNIKKKEPSPMMDNLVASVKVNTAKPLVYKTAAANVEAKADLLIQKAPMGPLYVLGTVEILKNSTYTFEDKKFVFKKSLISFTGNPSNPILDIAAVYHSLHYEITIQVTGEPSTPNIIFSSIPSLSREEILSVILFGSEEGAGSNSGDDMMKMMGGAMAKSALANAGIKIDYLTLGANGNMEIGKKLSDKITIIYVNDEVAGAKLQYDYSKHIKGTISTNSESSGVGIIYKREFKNLKEFK